MAEKRPDAVKAGDKAAFENLLCSYEPLIRAECAALLSKFSDFRGEEEEMHQEGRLALYNAAMKYEDNGQVTFGLYAKICVHNRLVSYIRKLSSAKKRRDKLAEKREKQTVHSVEELAIAALNSESIKAVLDEVTSPYEKRVVALYLKKKSYAEIAAAVGKCEKSVANAICRVKAKLKKRLQ